MKLLFLLLALLCSCHQKENTPLTTEIQGISMTIPYRIIIGTHLSPDEKKEVQEIANEVFQSVNSIYNHYNPHSEISKINASRSWEPIPLSLELAEAFYLADRVYRETDGRFDPTVLTLQKVWQEYLDKGQQAPNVNERKISWKQVHLKDSTITKKIVEIQFDLTGLAKGLCVDKITDALLQAGYKNFLVDWGGEIATRGEHPEKRPWRLYISHFGKNESDTNLGIIEMQDNAVATSGNYLQQWHVQDKVYTHVFDPEIGKPLEVTPEAVSSVSVLAPSCAYADALATSIMLFKNIETAKGWSEEFTLTHPDVNIWLADKK